MMLKSKLCDYSSVYILVKGNETITEQWVDAAAPTVAGTKVALGFKYCAFFTSRMT